MFYICPNTLPDSHDCFIPITQCFALPIKNMYVYIYVFLQTTDAQKNPLIPGIKAQTFYFKAY